jgi:hypothetical protein
MEYKKEIMLFTGILMELETIMLNEVDQAENDKGHLFSLICGS